MDGNRITDEVLIKKAKKYLAQEGYGPVYGARPLKRTIQRLVADPLAMKILDGEFKEGDKVRIDYSDSLKTIAMIKSP